MQIWDAEMDKREKSWSVGDGVHIKAGKGVEVKITGLAAIAVCGVLLLVGSIIFMAS